MSCLCVSEKTSSFNWVSCEIMNLLAVAQINPDLGILIAFKGMSLKTGNPLMLDLVFGPLCHCSFA